jgi:hypothetical protein
LIRRRWFLGKWGFTDIAELLRWILKPDTLEQEDVRGGSSSPAQQRSFLGKDGFVRWLFSSETLVEEPESSRPVSRWGREGFFSWLFSPEELEEEPVVGNKSSPFGEAGFVRWLTGSEKIDKRSPDDELT